ncbi:RDD family protein [Canicola haemoglobinophilus]|uniref:RDD domain-containing protein n=1 Tax=Canicola haemoglobinophilus TaxID=733 RepID=A0A1V4B3S2_9PAST|nr:RDD family protein [Canicola haemoglobinophilus]OOS01998.1 RDD family protein [Canicola haemoglobinophilus]STO54112.1 RDD domain-containing protein [Canicola haemoglobinophilus]STO60452.1 RDD domain-containing protein [Canicola haemoglobinophilus]STO68645.1 RDD domain-containing protein [Canicola haemoglobinophilus]
MIVENVNEKNNSSSEKAIPISEQGNQSQINASRTSYIVYASRFKRWLATIINVLLFYVAMFIGFLILEDIGMAILIILYIGYQCFLIYNSKQTLGKKLLNLQVIDYATQQPLTFGRYMLRELVENIFSVTGILTLISAVVAFVSKERRSLTDAVMSTIVVKKN